MEELDHYTGKVWTHILSLKRKEQPAESECWAEAEYRPEWRGEVDYSYRKNNCAER